MYRVDGLNNLSGLKIRQKRSILSGKPYRRVPVPQVLHTLQYVKILRSVRRETEVGHAGKADVAASSVKDTV